MLSTKLKLLTAGLLFCSSAALYVFFAASPDQVLARRAEDYVQLALALDLHQPGEVDHYFGPATLIPNRALTPEQVSVQAQALADEIRNLEGLQDEDRQQRLLDKLEQLQKIASFLSDPAALTFAEETGQLYQLALAERPETMRMDEAGRLVIDKLPPTAMETRRDEILAQLRELLPGTGSLAFRVARFQASLQVPLDKREEVFAAAMQACREATVKHWNLPADEIVEIEWTRDVGSPWHEYRGGHRSLLRINPLTMAYIGSMIDVACHEAYPGHHSQFLLQETRIADSQSRHIENTLAMLRSGQAALLEAAAEYAVDLAMPPAQRLEFERSTLFPLAGLANDSLETYTRIHALVGDLAMATVPVLQEYSDGELPETAAAVRLERDALVASPRALLRFVDDFGAYAVSYTLAEQHLRSYIDNRRGQTGESAWNVLALTLANPKLLEPVFTE